MDLSFSGAGFMGCPCRNDVGSGCYYFGVVDCWNKYIPKERVNRVIGSSAGSLIAAYYLMDLPLSNVLREIIEMTEDLRRRPLGVFDRSNQIVDILPKILDKLFPEDAHKRVSGKLHICITRLKDMKKIIVNEFESKKDLIDALNCSCFIPVWSGNHVATYKGIKHIDGGFTDNLPVFDEHTIRICCFSGQSDISPYDKAKMELLSGTVLNMPFYINFANCRRFRKALFPPPVSYMVDLLERGFHDTKGFILTNDLIQCDSCYGKTDPRDQLIYSKISPTITPSVTPLISRSGSFINVNKIHKLKDYADKKQEKSRFLQPSEGLNVADDNRNSPMRSSFNMLLQAKLQEYSPDSNVLSGSDVKVNINDSDIDKNNNNNNNLAPVIVIYDPEQSQQASQQAIPSAEKENNKVTESAKENDSSDGNSIEESPRKKVRPNCVSNEKFFARRNTVQESQLFVIKDKFTLAPNQLPSCPPSPNLNRHCTSCIKMRQEARVDLIAENIKREADKYRVAQIKKENRLMGKLTSPLKWLRQLGIKSSYTFEEPPVSSD